MTIDERIRVALEDEADGGRLPLGFSVRVIRSLPQRRPVVRWRLPVAAASAAAVVVVAALVAAQISPAPAPAATASPGVGSPPAVMVSGSPTNGPSKEPSPAPATTTYPDGVPVSIGDQPVLRGKDIVAHAVAATDDSSFLITGRFGYLAMFCVAQFSPPPAPLLQTCGGFELGTVVVHGPIVATWSRFFGRPLVARVHAHDPQAEACPPASRATCNKELVAEALVWVPPADPNDHRADVVDGSAGRYDDGLPRGIGGQPVLRGADAIARAQATTDTSSFLVGGWVTRRWGPSSCPVQLAGQETWSFECGAPTFADLAGTVDGTLGGAITYRFAMDGLATGPVVVSAHVHDPRALECSPDPAICDGMMVVERIVWAGDSATDPSRLSPADVAAALRSVDPARSMTPVGPDASPTTCAPLVPGAASYVVLRATDETAPVVMYVAVATDRQALVRAVPVAEGTTGALSPKARICATVTGGASNPNSTSTVERWLTFDNVALIVSIHAIPTTADRAYLDRLTAALTARLPGQ